MWGRREEEGKREEGKGKGRGKKGMGREKWKGKRDEVSEILRVGPRASVRGKVANRDGSHLKKNNNNELPYMFVGILKGAFLYG